jgi:hypothetical protein
MKVNTIKVSELEDYIQYRRMERDLAMELTHLKEITKLKLEILKRANPLAKRMSELRKGSKRYKEWENDEEVKKILNKIGYYNVKHVDRIFEREA